MPDEKRAMSVPIEDYGIIGNAHTEEVAASLGVLNAITTITYSGIMHNTMPTASTANVAARFTMLALITVSARSRVISRPLRNKPTCLT